MNLQEFTAAYNALGPEYFWTVTGTGCVRATYPGIEAPMCPIEAVHHSRSGTQISHSRSATSLGLRDKDRRRIVRAADNDQKRITERRLRGMMLSKVQPSAS